MKLGEFFISLGIKGNTKELETTQKRLKELEKSTRKRIKYLKDLKKAETDEEKQLVKENYQQNLQIDKNEKLIEGRKEFNKTLDNSIKGFSRFITGVSLAVGVLDRLINANAKANRSVLTLSKTSGVSLDEINKYASSAVSVNSQASREAIGQTMGRISQFLFDLKMGQADVSAIYQMGLFGGKSFNPWGMDTLQFIEAVRDGIKGINDIDATNIIQKLGFSPDDLLWLRMSREEFENIVNIFPDEFQSKELEVQAQNLRKIHEEINALTNELLIEASPVIKEFLELLKYGLVECKQPLIELLQDFSSLIKLFNESKPVRDGVLAFFVLWLARIHPVITALTSLYLIYKKLKEMWINQKDNIPVNIVEETEEQSKKYPASGKIGKALLGLAYTLQEKFPKLGNLPIRQTAPVNTSSNYNNNSNFNQNNQITINNPLKTADESIMSNIEQLSPKMVLIGQRMASEVHY